MNPVRPKAPPRSAIPGWVTVMLGLSAVFSAMSILVTVYHTILLSKNQAEQALSDLDTLYRLRAVSVETLIVLVKETKAFETYRITMEKELLPLVAEMKATATKLTLRHPDETNRRLMREANMQDALLKSLDKLLLLSPHYQVIPDPPLATRNAMLNDLQWVTVLKGWKHSLQDLESEIQLERQMFDGAIRRYNRSIRIFPANVLAPCWRFAPLRGFEVSNPKVR